jgi:hypothetical protein
VIATRRPGNRAADVDLRPGAGLVGIGDQVLVRRRVPVSAVEHRRDVRAHGHQAPVPGLTVPPADAHEKRHHAALSRSCPIGWGTGTGSSRGGLSGSGSRISSYIVRRRSSADRPGRELRSFRSDRWISGR